jgi:hypothetical protein
LAPAGAYFYVLLLSGAGSPVRETISSAHAVISQRPYSTVNLVRKAVASDSDIPTAIVKRNENTGTRLSYADNDSPVHFLDIKVCGKVII